MNTHVPMLFELAGPNALVVALPLTLQVGDESTHVKSMGSALTPIELLRGALSRGLNVLSTSMHI